MTLPQNSPDGAEACRYLLKDEEQALDAMQDTFVR
jgi:DNA-directed RNA polymerase specialized sigma24 family protein